MGLGPVWRLRGTATDPTQASDTTPSPIAWTTASSSGGPGQWVVVVDGDDPFSGAAGKLLDAMLAAIGATRGSSSLPPDLDDAIASVNPALVLCLGDASAALLLGAGAQRGTVHRRSWNDRDIAIVCSANPTRLLGEPAGKAAAWADLCLARRAVARDDPDDGTA